MLHSYYQHVLRYENSLVTKFYGVHCVKPIGGQKVSILKSMSLYCSNVVDFKLVQNLLSVV